MNDDESVFSRWSRRKLQAKAEAAGVASAPVQSPQAVPAAPAAALPVERAPQSPEDGVKPEYCEFFDPRVEEALRRSALRKLFSDPQFNVMDGLDTYIDDYSKPDPIPAAMLRRLNQAKGLALFDEEDRARTDGETLAAGDAATATPAAAKPARATAASEPVPPNPMGPHSGATPGPAIAQAEEDIGEPRHPVDEQDARAPAGLPPRGPDGA